MDDKVVEIIKNWVLFHVFFGVMAASVPMLWTGRIPVLNKKANPVLSTALFVVGMTGFLVYGTQDLLQATIDLITG